MVKSGAVLHLSVPQYDSLSINKIFKFLQNHNEVYKFLPDKEDLPKVPKQWLVNMVYTIVREDFSDWVKRHIEDRNEKMASEQNLLLEMDP